MATIKSSYQAPTKRFKTVYIDCRPSTFTIINELGLNRNFDDLHIHVGQPEGAELLSLMNDAQVVLTGRTHIGRDVLSQCRQLKKVVFLGTGAESYIDLPAARDLNIEIGRVRNYGNRTNAEHAFALILDAARSVSHMDRSIRAGGWDCQQGMELQGKQLGVIGIGGIGSELIRMAHAFGLRVCAWNRSNIDPGLPCTQLSWNDLLQTSDILSLHLGYNTDTHGIIGETSFNQMKKGVIFINTARGALVNESAMLKALRSGVIRHAGLDVFETEPLPASHPLRDLPNVTLTAHAAFNSKEAFMRLITQAFDMLRDGAPSTPPNESADIVRTTS